MDIRVSISGIPPVLVKAAFVLLLVAPELGDISTLLAVALIIGRMPGDTKQ